MSDSLWPHDLQHARLPCPSPTPGACSDSCTLSWWCHPKFPFFVVPFSSYLQSFPASGFFLKIQLFPSGSQSIGPSVSASVLPINIQDWFPLGLTDLISLQSKGLSRVFSSTTVQKHQFFGAQPSLWSSSPPSFLLSLFLPPPLFFPPTYWIRNKHWSTLPCNQWLHLRNHIWKVDCPTYEPNVPEF